jgi:GTP cyclohydrolase I
MYLDKTTAIKSISHHMECIIKDLGLDLDSIHLKGTPDRVARMFVNEMFSGMYDPMPKFTTFDNVNKVNEMTFLGPIDLFSTCSHHFKSFSGKAYIAYIPGRKLVGISKLARITDWFARRPQVQEELNAQIANFLDEMLEPEGIGVHIEAVHNCIRVRGAKQSSSVMKTTALRGCFKTDKTVASEFMWMIQNNK